MRSRAEGRAPDDPAASARADPRARPPLRAPLHALALVALLAVLLVTGLGLFRLHASLDPIAGDDGSGTLFRLVVRGVHEAGPDGPGGWGGTFWAARAVTLALALALPWFRVLGASLAAAAAALALVWLHVEHGGAVARVPLEFELLLVAALYASAVALAWLGERRDRRRLANLLGQYVPPELAALYSRDPDSMGLAGDEREVTVLFCDVEGFSAVSETLGPERLREWLNGFFELVGRVVVRHRGTIDKLMGDSVMAVWGAPARSATHAFDALSAALDLERELVRLDERYRAAGLPELRAGIGLSTGPATVGPLGSRYRMDYTVVGDTVNVAQRLEAQTRKYRVPVIVSDATAEALPDVLFRELDTVVVKGRAMPVTMHEPLGRAADADEATRAWLELHREAMAASKLGEWARAASLFERLRDGWGPPEMYELYLRGIARASG